MQHTSHLKLSSTSVLIRKPSDASRLALRSIAPGAQQCPEARPRFITRVRSTYITGIRSYVVYIEEQPRDLAARCADDGSEEGLPLR